MPSEVLVTGTRGFVGRHLVPELRAAGHTVLEWTHEQGDITRAAFSAGARHVILLAARTFVPESWQSPAGFYEVNVMGTVNVLEYCRREGAALTLVSSYVYGTPERLPINEDHPVKAFTPYGHTKLMAEEVARSYSALHGVPVTIVRPFNLYGPGNDPRFVIPEILAQALDPERKSIRVKDRRPKRDYLYIADFVRLLVLIAGSENVGLRIFNAGSGVSTSVEDLVKLANKVTGHAKPLESEDMGRPGDVLDMYADIRRAEECFGWVPRCGIEAGLALTAGL